MRIAEYVADRPRALPRVRDQPLRAGGRSRVKSRRSRRSIVPALRTANPFEAVTPAPRRSPRTGNRSSVEIVSTPRMAAATGSSRRASRTCCASTRRRSAKRRTRISRSPRSTTTCRAATARRSSPCSISRCRRRRFRGRRSGRVRHVVPALLPGARGRASVVGPGGRLEELPRAMAERRAGAVLRAALRRRRSRAGRRSQPARPDASTRRCTARRTARSISATGSATCRATARLPRRSSTTSPPSSCTCCARSSATRRSSRPAPFLPRLAVPESRHRRSPAGVRAASGRSLQRFFNRWVFNAEIPRVRTAPSATRPARRPPDRAARLLRRRFGEGGRRHLRLSGTFAVQDADGTSEDVVVAVSEAVTTRRLDKPARRASVREELTLAEFVR